MLKLEQMKLRPGQPEELLAGKAAHMLRVPPEDILELSVLRKAVDARQPLRLVYTLAVQVRGEKTVLRRCRDKNVTVYAPEHYAPPGLRARFGPPGSGNYNGRDCWDRCILRFRV